MEDAVQGARGLYLSVYLRKLPGCKVEQGSTEMELHLFETGCWTRGIIACCG